ncbi:MAG: transcriptional regulator [Bacteroidetes bacterium 4572_117]|nr:MAG: transcriptional regulator [Bacteroidetes bacterium 4572_117]
MKLSEAKEKFINSWSSLGSKWGINRTMAQIHALFLISEQALSAEDVMETLKISRGNTNMNIRTLIDWGLVYKKYKAGERKEFFIGEKDIWTATKRVIRVRQQKELKPMLQILNDLSRTNQIDITKNNQDEAKRFTEQIKNMQTFANHAVKTLTKISNSKENWFWKTFLKLS